MQNKGFSVTEELKMPLVARHLERTSGGQTMYSLIDSRAVEAVILYTNDRTARDDYTIEYPLLKDHCYTNGIELH